MLKKNLVRCAVFSVAIIAACGSMNQFAVAADSGPIAVGMDTFATPDGNAHFALCLKPTKTAPAAGPRDVVVLFNTSRAHGGDSRAKGIGALKSALPAMPAGDRVKLMAVDLDAEPITTDFVAPDGKEMADALKQLNGRTPLGATNMEKALNTVAAGFTATAKRPRAVLYIGDGRSAANLLATDQFAKLTQMLVDSRIPVSSYIVGDRVDIQLPGALAAQTGGTVIRDAKALSSDEAGRQLAAAVNATVLWPTSTVWPAEMSEVLPKQLPPLRDDRETVVLGTFKGNGPFNVQVSADGAGDTQKLTFGVSPRASDDINNYLLPLVERARKDGGITLPLLGAASLLEARQETDASVRGLCKLARQAKAAGNLDSAAKLVAEALRQDPNDTEALAIKGALAKNTAAAAGGTAANAQPAGGAGDLTSVPNPAEPPPGAMAEELAHNRRVVGQMITAEVQKATTQARSLMSTNPDAASQELKQTMETVRQTAQLDANVRDRLVGDLQKMLRETSRHKDEFEQSRQQRLASEAAAKDRQTATSELVRNQDKVDAYIQRFNALMQEGKYRPAEEETVAAEKLLPDSPQVLLAKLDARQMGYHSEFMAQREARQKGVVDTLNQVERAHIPFAGDPPIVYPDAEWFRFITDKRKDRWSSMSLGKMGSAEKNIQEALKQPMDIKVSEMPLSDVVEYLKDRYNNRHPDRQIDIILDKRALDEASVTPDTPVTKTVKDISLRSGLKLLLKDLNLTYIIKNEVLLITTPEEAENAENYSTKVYPVADLVIPIQSMSMGGMGMMGGMGGMMGGMGGGMGGMGGGMGGMGGGMGGMGGGMGMYNVLHDVLPKVPAGGFQAFAVNDDLTVPAKAAAAHRSGKAMSSARAGSAADAVNRPARIDMTVGTFDKNVKPEILWDNYFAKNQPTPKAVRDATRYLMNQQKFDHAIELIGAALRHGQGQPWMYESLALALDAAGRPKAEIERAVMSAVEFVDNTPDLMRIGAYLAQLGLNQRALNVYQLAAKIDPIRPEPYMLGLRVARAMDDLDGLKWASLGILSQVWPKEQADVWRKGVGVSKEVLDRLKAANRTKEADEFIAALDQAVARDCVVVVTWTGEADLDLVIEEPSGTVCSLQSPRTTAGGVLLGDAIAQTDRDSYGGHSEVYVCPKGFDGKYQLLVRRAWGKVVTGKVNVEVMTHYRTSDVINVQKKIPLNNDEVRVAFDLKNGRRKESLRDQQVANIVSGQITMSHVLAQQLETALDPGAMQALAAARTSSSTSDATVNAGRNIKFFKEGGAVGYEPVITVLPAGANMSVTGVISADRRYVRITPMPMFSGISQVNTFNTTSGSSSSSSGGTGNSGYSGLFSSGSNGSSGGGSGFGICFGGRFKNIDNVPGALFPFRGERGAVVLVAAQPGSPGDEAGLCPGDVIYRFDGQSLPVGDTVALLREKVIPLKIQGNVSRTIGVLRDGVQLELKVTWPRRDWQEPDDAIRVLPDRPQSGEAT